MTILFFSIFFFFRIHHCSRATPTCQSLTTAGLKCAVYNEEQLAQLDVAAAAAQDVVFYISPFEGEVFNRLVTANCRVYGPTIMPSAVRAKIGVGLFFFVMMMFFLL